MLATDEPAVQVLPSNRSRRRLLFEAVEAQGRLVLLPISLQPRHLRAESAREPRWSGRGRRQRVEPSRARAEIKEIAGVIGFRDPRRTYIWLLRRSKIADKGSKYCALFLDCLTTLAVSAAWKPELRPLQGGCKQPRPACASTSFKRSTAARPGFNLPPHGEWRRWLWLKK